MNDLTLGDPSEDNWQLQWETWDTYQLLHAGSSCIQKACIQGQFAPFADIFGILQGTDILEAQFFGSKVSICLFF